MQILDLSSRPNQRFSALVDGQLVEFSLRWSPLTQLWYLSVSLGLISITLGRQIVPDTLLLNSATFPGDVIALTFARESSDRYPSVNAWGATHDLVLLNIDEREVFRAIT